MPTVPTAKPAIPLTSQQLYRKSELKQLNTECQSTAQLTPLDDIVGQERAQQAVEFAMGIKEKGYNIARRTVAKYREQLGIPVARLRKEL